MDAQLDEAEVESRIRAAVLGFVQRGLPFGAIDVQARLQGDGAAVPLRVVTTKVRELFDAGLLRPFAYKRTHSKQRTRIGFVTTMIYAPPHASAAPAEAGSEIATRVPALAPFRYLGVGAREARKLAKQTVAAERSLESAAREMVRAGEMLLAVEALVGAPGMGRFAERELGMSRTTARRLVRVARLFREAPALGALASTRASVVYTLAAPTFPRPLRERILAQQAVEVEGRRVPLSQATSRDLRRAREAWTGAQPSAPPAPVKPAEQVAAFVREARKLAAAGAVEGLDPASKRSLADALRRLADALSPSPKP